MAKTRLTERAQLQSLWESFFDNPQSMFYCFQDLSLKNQKIVLKLLNAAAARFSSQTHSHDDAGVKRTKPTKRRKRKGNR
jgi:hypothetical protein